MRHHWIVLTLTLALAACGDPLRGIERVSDLPPGTAPEDGPTLATPSTEPDQPILAGLFRRSPDNATPAQDVPSAEQAADAADQPEGPDVAQAPDDADASQIDTASRETPQRRGVMGWLRQAAASKADDQPTVTRASVDTATAAETPDLAVDPEKAEAVLAPEADGTDSEQPQSPRRFAGLFAPRSDRSTGGPRSGPDALDVPLGTVLPFGQIARVCEAGARDMGPIVERAARKGQGYNLHDSAPGSTGPRTYYVTGFSDNCPRQFTAALALFATPEAHEQLRYGLPARNYPYSSTDEAYETVKKQVCNVGRQQPCGPRVARMEKTTIFISAYENFSGSARWADMLLHDGEVMAKAVKTP